MQHLIDEYYSLVYQTRILLENQLPKTPSPKKTSFLPPKKTIKPEESPPPPIKIEEPVQTTHMPPKIPTLKTCGSFTLEQKEGIAFIDLRAMRDTLQKIHPQSIPSTLFLYYKKEDAPFLEKVAAALTQHGHNSSIQFITPDSNIEKHLSEATSTTIITEYTPLLNTIKNEKLHTFLPFIKGKQLFLLHPLANYELDKELKRDLWNRLKTLLP